MKKNIALIISILVLVLLILFLEVDIPKGYTDLKGEEISEGIYQYDLASSAQEIYSLTIKDDEVYYLLNTTNGYELKKLDIYQNQITNLGELANSNYDCTFKDEKIYCVSTTGLVVYNFDLEEQFRYTSDDENYVSEYIPYKDIYLKVEGTNIYLIRNSTEQLYRSIDNTTSLLYEDYFASSSDTYILFLDENSANILYSLEDDEFVNLGKTNYFKYENGFVFYDEYTYIIYDLENLIVDNYSNYTQTSYYYLGIKEAKEDIMYLYDILDDELEIINLEDMTIAKLDTTIFTTTNPLANLFVSDGYLFIYILQDTANFYVVDKSEFILNSTEIEEYTDEQTRKISEAISSIKLTYNVNVHIKEEAIIDFPDFYAEELTNNEVIFDALEKIESILAKYDKTFFDTFYINGYDGLNLYLTGDLTPSDYETQASNPAAYSLVYSGKYMIVIDLNQPNIEELLCHELLHNIEFNLNNRNISIFNNWNNYNPVGFRYNNSYTSNYSFNYTLSEVNINDVYFIDYYSQTYATEDRARVFERICACESDSIVNEYPNLYEKGLYLKEEIIRSFPSLNDTDLFNSLNTN